MDSSQYLLKSNIFLNEYINTGYQFNNDFLKLNDQILTQFKGLTSSALGAGLMIDNPLYELSKTVFSSINPLLEFHKQNQEMVAATNLAIKSLTYVPSFSLPDFNLNYTQEIAKSVSQLISVPIYEVQNSINRSGDLFEKMVNHLKVEKDENTNLYASVQTAGTQYFPASTIENRLLEIEELIKHGSTTANNQFIFSILMTLALMGLDKCTSEPTIQVNTKLIINQYSQKVKVIENTILHVEKANCDDK